MKDKYVFPRVEGQAPGLELRDLFAGFAAAGIIAATDKDSLQDAIHERNFSWEAEGAYALADAMLKARDEE